MTIDVDGRLSNTNIRELQVAVAALQQGGGGNGTQLLNSSDEVAVDAETDDEVTVTPDVDLPPFSWRADAPSPPKESTTRHDAAAVGGIVRRSLVTGTITRGGSGLVLGAGVEEDASHVVAGGTVVSGGDLDIAAEGPQPEGFVYLYSGEAVVKSGDTTVADGAEVDSLYLYSARTDIRAGDVVISGTPSGTPQKFGARHASVIGGSVIAGSIALEDMPISASGQAGLFGGSLALQNTIVSGATLTVGGGACGAGGDARSGDITLAPGAVPDGGGTGGDIDIRNAAGAHLLATTDGSPTLTTFNQVALPIHGVAVNIASVHAALVTLGFITE